MAYDDGYYYGQCKIVAVVDNTADNGKTVLITTDDNKTYSGTIANKKCEFLLPPRTLYTVQKASGESAEFTTKVEAGYGDCILVHLDTGYVEVKQGDIVGLDYIKAATDDSLKNKVPEAKAVKELNNSFQWKLIGSATGTTPITLPSNFSEILVIVKMNDYFYNFNIPKLYLDETNKTFCHGKGLNPGGSYYLTQIRILISTNKVALRDAKASRDDSLTDNTSKAIITAYYR